MSKYRVQINNIEKIAREFGFNEEGELHENTFSYINSIQDECSKLHESLEDVLIQLNFLANAFCIKKESFSVIDIDENKTLSYDNVWRSLSKQKVIFKSDPSKTTRRNIFKLLEPLIDISTGKVVCITSYFNLSSMIHIDELEKFNNNNTSNFIFEAPMFLLKKANGQKAGIFNKFFNDDIR